jgi:hypothetical protein
MVKTNSTSGFKNSSLKRVSSYKPLIKGGTEMISTTRALKKQQTRILKNSSNPLDLNVKPISQNPNFGEIHKDTSTFKAVLETLLESNILLLEKQNIKVDERLKLISISDCVEEVIFFHNNLVKHNRIPFCFTFFKEVTSFCITLLETPKGEHSSVKTPRTSTGVIDRWPTSFQKMRPLFFNARDRTEIGHICDQIIRSILNVHRLCEDFKEISLESITKPGKPLEVSFKNDFKRFVKEKFLEFTIIGDLSWDTTLNIDQSKNGPNSVLSYKSSDKEAFKLLNTKRFSIPFKKLCELTNNQDLYNYIESRSKAYQDDLAFAYTSNKSISSRISEEKFIAEERQKIFLRKLSGVPDSGHKSRTIAMCDFWTQTILEPTESHLIQATMKLYPNSCDYFSHSKGFKRMFERLKVGDVFYDCSNWTDRFPVELQEIVYESLYNTNISKCWMDLVVKCPWAVKDSSQTVRYSVGQGMGTRGSFQIAQLTSCLLMDYIFVTKYGIKDNSNLWAEVGDDMGCHDPKGFVLEFYNYLDIPINLSKTKHTSDNNLCMEYVSRNVNFGYDVSRISARNCIALDENLLDITSLILHISERTNSFDHNIMFNKLIRLKNRSGSPKWKFPAWLILYKTLVVKNIIYPNDVLGSIAIPLKNALIGNGIKSHDLVLFNSIQVNSEFRTLLKIAVLDNISVKIQNAGKALEEKHFKEEGIPFPEINVLLVDAIVKRSLENKENILKFPWKLLPEVNNGCATYHLLLAMSTQKYHQFVSEFFGSGILNGKDFLSLNSEESYVLLDNLEQELSKVLISLMPKQIFRSGNTLFNEIRRKMSFSYSLLKYFSTEESTNQVKLKFKSEIELYKELTTLSKVSIDVSSFNVPEKVVDALVPIPDTKGD